MRNFIQRGDTLTIPAPADVLSGGVVQMGAIVGVANGSATQGAPVDVDVVGVFSLPKVAATAVAVGDVLYWDATAKLVTKTATANTRLGVATEPAGAGAAEVAVRLNGSF
jgi:predicted RecA/RadA family phage recombinase